MIRVNDVKHQLTHSYLKHLVFVVKEWMAMKKLKYLGMPKFISFGSHTLKDSKYRFLVMDRFGTDLQKKFEQSKNKFSLKTVLTLGIKMVSSFNITWF